MKKVVGNTYVTGILRSNVVNKNGRIYDPEIFKKIKKEFIERTDFMFGTLGYGETVDSSVTDISHKINRIFTKRIPRKKKKKLKKFGLFNNRKSTLYCEVELLKTPKGAIVKQILDQLVLRPKAIGSVDNVNGKDVVNSDYKLLSVDFIKKMMMHSKA